MFKIPKLSTILLSVIALFLLAVATPETNAARTSDLWQERFGTYLETSWDEGRDILINGVNKYLNFGTTSGSSGYGIRDNAGTMEYKNDGGSWAAISSGGGSGTTTGSNWDIVSGGIETGTTTDFARAAYFISTSTTDTNTFAGNLTIGSLFKINAPTGNPEFNFQENGTTRAKTYYDVAGNQLVFQNNEVNTDDALYFADSATFTNKLTVDGTTRLATSLTGFLKAVSGTVSATSTISLNTDISGILGATNGGTGLTSTSTLLYESEIDTSAKLRGLLSDELGTGPAVFASSTALTSPTLYSPTIITALLTGIIDAGGATSFEIPNGTAPAIGTTGEIALDTTGNQLLVASAGGNDRVVQIVDQLIWSRTIASTSIAFINGSTMPLTTRLDGFTITRIQCHVMSGTSKVIAIEDASGNSSEDITCGTTNTTDDGSITNATYTASELAFIDFGATSGAVDYVSISVFGNWTRE